MNATWTEQYYKVIIISSFMIIENLLADTNLCSQSLKAGAKNCTKRSSQNEKKTEIKYESIVTHTDSSLKPENML